MFRENDHPIEGRWQLGEWTFNRCPKTYITENMHIWLMAYRMFKNGLLPSSGGWMDQTNKFLQVIDFIDASLIEHDNSQAKNGRK